MVFLKASYRFPLSSRVVLQTRRMNPVSIGSDELASIINSEAETYVVVSANYNYETIA